MNVKNHIYTIHVFSLFCNNIDYVTYIYEFHHLSRPDLPEYKEWSDFDFREELLDTNIRKSLLLIVDTQKKGKDLIKYYNCFEDKINGNENVECVLKE